MVKSLPAMQETQVRLLGQEDPLEKGMQTIRVFLPGEFHGQRSVAGYSPWVTKSQTQTINHHFLFHAKLLFVIHFKM